MRTSSLPLGAYSVPVIGRKETRSMPRITKRTVDALGPAERERIVWDDDITGFGVRAPRGE